MEFTKKDKLILQTLVAYFKENYGNVFLVAINDTQTLGVSGEMTNERVVDNLLGLIETFQKENSNPEVNDTKKDDDLISSVKEFIEDAKNDLEELDIRLLKHHLEVLKETIDDIEADKKASEER